MYSFSISRRSTFLEVPADSYFIYQGCCCLTGPNEFIRPRQYQPNRGIANAQDWPALAVLHFSTVQTGRIPTRLGNPLITFCGKLRNGLDLNPVYPWIRNDYGIRLYLLSTPRWRRFCVYIAMELILHRLLFHFLVICPLAVSPSLSIETIASRFTCAEPPVHSFKQLSFTFFPSRSLSEFQLPV